MKKITKLLALVSAAALRAPHGILQQRGGRFYSRHDR